MGNTKMVVKALFAAFPQPFGPRRSPSAIVKNSVNRLTVHTDRTDEDEQGNKKLHGGSEKVIHQYSFESYKHLCASYPDVNFLPGSIGENILVEAMDDKNVCIGDIYRFGDVVLQVSAPRAPCNKISHRYGIKNLDRFVGKHGITGWYYRVLETGCICINDEVELIEQAEKSVSIHDLMTATYDVGDPVRAADYSTISLLDDEWHSKCQRIIARAT